MNTKLFCLAFFLYCFCLTVTTQSELEPTPTPVKVIVTDSMPTIKLSSAPVPRVSPTPIIVGSSDTVSGPSAMPENASVPVTSTAKVSGSARTLSFGQMKSRIAEAKRYMQSRPLATALSEGTVPTDFVRVAFQDWKNDRIDYVVLSKEAFLSIVSEKLVSSENGRSLRVRTIRGNGVNTPIVIVDDSGETHLPLLVQYPVVREGKYMETAYYMSTHPGLGTPEVVNAGRYYVHNVIEIARDRLKEKGIFIQPKVADIAERLATVEHVDHMRFRTELHQNIFNDIFTLYALNEGQTYRYSVSSAVRVEWSR